MFEGWDFWSFFWMIYWAMLLPAWIISAKAFKYLDKIDPRYKESSGEDFVSVLLGFCMMWFWPLFLPAALVYKAVTDD